MNHRLKVLVVDDDPIVLEVTRARLEAAGYEVVIREDGVGTSNAVAQENPDVVLLDITMPGISGEAIAKLITHNPKRAAVSVIFHSTRGQAELDVLASECRALGAIEKTNNSALFRLQFERLVMSRYKRSYTPPSGRW